MSNASNRKEEEILRKQRALYSEISKSKEKPPAPPSGPPKHIQNHSKPASLSELLGREPHKRKPPPPKSLQSIDSKTSEKKDASRLIIDLTTDSPEKIQVETREKPAGVVTNHPKPMAKTTTSSSSSSCSKIQTKPLSPPPPPPSISSTNIKRPSMRKRKQMDAAINVARQRIKDATIIMEQKQTSNDTILSTSTTTDSTTKGGGLASLLNQVGVTNAQLHSKASAQISWVEEEDRQGSLLEVEDYYKCMREWDFLKDWNKERMMTTNRGKVSNENDDLKTKDSQDVLPDTFTSRKQYQKLWAPLCLQEAKAQILSNASSALPWKDSNESRKNGTGNKNRSNIYSPVPVVVRPKAQKSSLYPESFNVVIESKSKVQGLSFSAGDIVVLAYKEFYFSDAAKGRLKISNDCLSCIVGNVEYSRRTIDDLKVIVSRKSWLQLCKNGVEENMYLLNLGGSVTNVREFTSLCRINTIPLLPYILCRKMTKAKDGLDALSNLLSGDISTSRKQEHLQNMGGKNALGEGFMKYASSKFNHSQLGAISAAAKEYGEGGFTLIKGPPGMLLTMNSFFFCALI